MASAATPSSHTNYTTSALHKSGATPTGIFAAPVAGVNSVLAPTSNELLNSDVELYAGGEDSFSVAAEGRLTLHKKKHHSSYTGTFFDNLSNRAYKASAKDVSTTDETGVYTIHTANGKFTFSENSDASSDGKAPKKYGKKAMAGLGYAPHAYTVRSNYELDVSEFSIGKYVPLTTGHLTFTTDSLNFVAPHNKGRHIAGSYAYTQAGHKGTAIITSWGEYYEQDSEPIYALFTIRLDGHHVHFVSDENEDGDDDGVSISGTGSSGHTSRTTFLSFELTTTGTPAPID